MAENGLIPNKLRAGILAGLLLLGLAVCSAASAAQEQGPEERQVRAMVQNLAQAFLKKDMNAMLAVASDDAELVVEGLAGSIRHQGRDAIRAAYARDLKALAAPTLSFLGLEVQVRQTMAQATAEVMAGGRLGADPVAVPARLSALLEKRQGKWRVYFAKVRYPLLRPEFDQLLGR